tara:strand:+ start:275 stop:502 length:228 start_codon:yes stop_codon:yes gene_type:complete
MLKKDVDVLRRTQQVLANKQAEMKKLQEELQSLKTQNFSLLQRVEELEKKLLAPKRKRTPAKQAAKNDDTKRSAK